MKYRLPRNSTESYEMMLNYLKADPSRVEAYMPFLKEMFEKFTKSSSNHKIFGDLACVVLNFLDKNPSQIKTNKSVVEGIVFGSLYSPISSIKLENVLEDFLTKYQNKCGFTA